jgi:hypothetical protein
VKPLSRAELRAWVVRHAAVLDAGATESPFACADWTLHFLDHVARDDWRFWVAGSVLPGCGAMLLYSEPARPAEVRALTNYYASLYSPSVGSTQPEAFAAIAHDLSSQRPALATVHVAPMSEPQASLVQTALKGAGWVTRRHGCHGNWFLPCSGLSFEQYMAARPSQLVNTWTRKSKKFRRGGQARLQLVTAPADVDAAMDAYDAVYARSWKTPEPYPRFVRDWAAICAARGWLRLGIAWVDDLPIAAQFWFTRHGRANIFKLAYDEAQAKWSAGTVLSAFLFEHSLDVDRVVEIDYLTGDDAYKQSWMTERRERVGVIACNPRTLRGLLRGAYEWAGAMRQQWRATHATSHAPRPERAVSD